MIKQFLSSIGYGALKIDTVVDAPNVAFGENLVGKIYIEGGDNEQLIEHIEMELLRRTEEYRMDSDFDVVENTITKHSIELVNLIKSKETSMIPFELVPDERWQLTYEKDRLILRTTVFIKNGVNAFDEDEITYG